MSTTRLSLKNNDKGFALISMTLIAIALLSILSAVFAFSGKAISQSFYQDSCATNLVAQVNLIRTKVSKCVIEYPEGDNGTGYHKSYPAGAATTLVSNLTCPGAGSNLWTGVDGVFLPNKPNGFNDWQYLNNAANVKITIQTTNITAYSSCMSKALSKFTSSEASLTGDTLTVIITL